MLAVGLLPPATNIPTQPLGLPAANIRQHHRVIFQSKGADVLFPQDRMAVSSMLLADDDDVTRTDDEDAAAAKARAELIFGVIVANSIFWQYILPVFKGQPTSDGRKKK